MRNMFWLNLFGVITMGVAGIAQAAPEGAATLRVAAANEAPASAVSATGVVRQVKPEAGKVKISHDPIPALEWPAMTMDFRVKDKAVLQGIGPGDKVRFELEKDAKGLAITRMEKVAK
ncbi:MAG: copper-binding protein [Bacteroidota bacterium]